MDCEICGKWIPHGDIINGVETYNLIPWTFHMLIAHKINPDRINNSKFEPTWTRYDTGVGIKKREWQIDEKI